MEATTSRKPIRGVLYGIVFGLGLMLLAIGQGWAALGTWPPFLLLLVGIIVGTLWSTVGPAKGPKPVKDPTKTSSPTSASPPSSPTSAT